MSLPSKYAPGGLSSSDQHRTITSGNKRSNKPINYTIRTIEDRVNDAFENKTYTLDTSDDRDIEMVPMDDYNEVAAISDFVTYTRNDAATVYSSPDFPEVADPVEEGLISYLVLDTNFILSHLNVVDGLKKIAAIYGLRIIIPTMVMMELDGLKKSTRTSQECDERLSGKSVGLLARWANDWIYSMLADTSPVVSGQKIHQKIDKRATQDEAILDCGLYFQKSHPSALVVLLSNDKNLCIKALANGLLIVSYRKDMTPELIAQRIHGENKRQSNGSYKVLMEENIEMEIEVEPIDFHQCVSTIFREVQILTLSVVHHCMESVYGEDLALLRNYDHDSIRTLDDCAGVLIRFWSTVFRVHFRKLSFTPFDESSGRIKTPLFIHEPTNDDELKQFVDHWSTALEILYLAEMDPGQNAALKKLITRWCQMADVS